MKTTVLMSLCDPIPFERVSEMVGGAAPSRQTTTLHDAWREYASKAARPYTWKTFDRYARRYLIDRNEWSFERGKEMLAPWQNDAQAMPRVLVLGPSAALRVRRGALDIDHGPDNERRSMRIDVDAEAKPRAILFDGKGEFLTGEAIRWCARYSITLVFPNGVDGLITTCSAARDLDGGTGTDPEPALAQCRAALDKELLLRVAREIVRRKIEAEGGALAKFPRERQALGAWAGRLDVARTLNDILIVESHAAAIYWRPFRDMGLRVRKSDDLPRSWLRYPRRGRGRPAFQEGIGGGRNNASHPINAMLNYAYVVEASRLARALTARGFVLQFGFLHKPKTGRNSLVWDTIEPLRPLIDARVFDFVSRYEFSRSDFPQVGLHAFRLSRDVTQLLLHHASLSASEIEDTIEWMVEVLMHTQSVASHPRSSAIAMSSLSSY